MSDSSSVSAPARAPHCLASFADCVNLALVLAGDFDHVHVAALTGLDGHVTDGIILSEPWHTIDHAVGYALCLVRSQPDTHADLTLITVAATGAKKVRDVDVRTWRRSLDAAAGQIRCRDWILTDGRSLRSMAVTTGSGRSWPTAPAQPD